MALLHHDKDDKYLLSAYYEEGDTAYLGILLQRYTGMLLGVSMKYLKDEDEAKDSVQQIFLKVLKELSKHKVDYFKSWLYMVAKNHCLMKIRDNKHHVVEIKETMITAANEADEKELHVNKEQSLNRLEAALKLLGEEQRVCLTLFYLNNKTYQQITEVTAFTLLQVKSNIQNGKRNLKIIMQSMT